MKEITNYDDVIDSWDVLKRIEELEAYAGRTIINHTNDSGDWCPWSLAPVTEGYDDDRCPAGCRASEIEDSEISDDERDELAGLRRFAQEGEQLTDWFHGETLIRDSYFEDYARDLADDLSTEPLANAVWPFTCIDWEKAAEELQVDYTSIEFGDVTYWAR